MKQEHEHVEYFAYLRQRSLLGLWYRRFWVYPRMSRHVRGRVLDIGCGIGDFLAFRPGTVGVDVNSAAVDWCKSRGLDAHPMEYDTLPFVDGSFDSVTLDNVLEHIADPRALLCEIRRVLRNGGRLVVGVPGKHGYSRDSDHKKYYDEGALKSLMESSGYRCAGIFHTPIKSKWLDAHIPQYCVYGAFESSGAG